MAARSLVLGAGITAVALTACSGGSSGNTGGSFTGHGKPTFSHLTHVGTSVDRATVTGTQHLVDRQEQRIAEMPGVSTVTLNTVARTITVTFEQAATAGQRAAVERILSGK